MVFVAISLFFCLITAPYAGAVSIESPPSSGPAKIESPLLVTGYAFSGSTLLYVQLYNSSNEVIDISGWEVEYRISAQVESVKIGSLEGMLKPGGYIIMGEQTSMPSADFAYIISTSTEPSAVQAIKVIAPSRYLESVVNVKTDAKNNHWKRNVSTSTGNYLSTFTSFAPDNATILYGRGLYEPPEVTQIQFTEILANPRNCSPAEDSKDCADFVKFYNPTSQPIDLSQFRLRVGYKGQAPTSGNTFSLAGIIAPGGYYTVTRSSDDRPISLLNSGSYIWLEDIYGVRQYSNTTTEYPDASSESKKGQAWAYDSQDATWKWTLKPVPFNSASEFVFPVVAKSKVAGSLTPCKEGQYRSEETNRCRSATSVTTALAPCDEDEERNPDTNRCRKMASLASSELAPCKEGQERNPETNRCRNVISSPPDSAFKPEPIADTGKAFAGWWALGGVGTLALGYGAWEWRREVFGFVQRVGSFFTSSK